MALPKRKLSQFDWLVSTTRRSRRSEKTWLPVKLMRCTEVTRPSLISKTRSTRFSGWRMITGVTEAA